MTLDEQHDIERRAAAVRDMGITAAAARIAELEAALRTLVHGYYSEDDALPTLEQWDDARSLIGKR